MHAYQTRFSVGDNVFKIEEAFNFNSQKRASAKSYSIKAIHILNGNLCFYLLEDGSLRPEGDLINEAAINKLKALNSFVF